ncbi:dynein regulatory complex subunit 3 isoform X2 [Halyomorpha halys]|uniref:dynein regulatory complex subunit 3 isoform X2 n=1 Tax=Halyomorpha halys TaxID=286706 RepID=UPI000D0C8781|nr:dynein regulatory complex subunit 3-like isoform X2 [Halyomorpha halys]
MNPDILKIDHLWMMKNLQILTLAHNNIETIENLEELVNLVQLDLSFNKIERIENLWGLKNMKVLCLYNNKIKVIEQLDDQEDIEIFSIGNNLIEDRSCILYLRRFKKLVSINMANNPCTKEKYFKETLAAYMPKLLYYEYKLITHKEREIGLEHNAAELDLLEIEETKRQNEEEQMKIRKEKEDFFADAFIEGLGTNQLFNRMFFNDIEGKAFKDIGPQVFETYDRLRTSVNEICMDICKAGEDNYKRRLKEVDIFVNSWEGNQKAAEQQSFHQQVELLRKWKHLVSQMGKFLQANAKQFRSNDEYVLHKTLEEFEEILAMARDQFEEEWYKLMEVEMKTYDKNEAVINLYESGLFDIINVFIEKSQTYFTQLRDSETDFIDDMTVKLNKYMVEVYQRTDRMNVPILLRNIVCDKDSLSNAIIACHDKHTLAIDLKEDYIVSKLKEWHAKETAHLQRTEILRNRKAVLKIRDSVDKANRLYEKKALVMLNFFRTPEPLFQKKKKDRIFRLPGDSGESDSDEQSDWSSRSEEEIYDEKYIHKITSETDFREDVDWTKLLDSFMKETETIRPKDDGDMKRGSDGEEETEEEEEELDKVALKEVLSDHHKADEHVDI